MANTTLTTYKALPFEVEPFNPDKDILIRQSTIGQFQMCPKRVEYDGQEGYLPMVSEPLAFGQCLHFMAAQDLIRDEYVSDMLSDMTWVDTILREEYEWSLSQVPDPHDFFQRLTVAYNEWRKWVRPTIKTNTIIDVEEDIYLYLGEGKGEGVRIFLRGTPDVVQKTKLLDWKTGSSKWTQDKVDVSIQASLYLALVKHRYNIQPKQFTFWTYYKPKQEWTPFTTKRTVAQINAAMRTAYDYGLQIEAGIYPATPVPETFQKKRGWYCSPKWCGAWNICEAKFLGDGVDETQVAIRSW